MNEPADRRAHRRVPAVFQAKIYQPASGTFAHAVTHDLSEGGVLISVDRQRSLPVGERVCVAVAFNGEAILAGSSLRQGVVVRAAQDGRGAQRIAVRFDRAASLSAAA